MEEEETEAGQRQQNRRRRRRRRRGRRQVELPKWRKFIAVADMAKSDLLFHFKECCRFVRDGRERGTVLVHWCVCVCERERERERESHIPNFFPCSLTHPFYFCLTHSLTVTLQ